MANFGDIHVDRNDDVTGLSCMTVLSDLPGKKGEEPGRFHFLALGVYVILEPGTVVYFSGRQPHGGTPPLSAPGKAPSRWALRCTLIAYPSGMILNGQSRHTLGTSSVGSNGTGLPFYITPEMMSLQ